MKKILLFFACIACISAHAQTAAKSVYAELGGPGLASVNFDVRFSKSEKGLGGRIGLGGFGVDGAGAFTIPLGLNYLLSKDQKNYFEMGAGFTPLLFSGKVLDETGNSNFTTSFGYLWLGYRLQPKDGGFTFRAGMCPVFGSGYFVPYYAGLSFGYKF